MKRLCLVATVGLLAVLAMSSASSAATIQEVLATSFNPTQYDFYASGYGHSGYFLTWSNMDPLTHQFLSGRTGRYLGTTHNPDSLDFSTITSGGNNGNPADPDINAPTVSLYRLGVNTGHAWSMDFSILFYDPDFAGTSALVELAGTTNETNNYKYRYLTTAEVDGGMMVKYHIDGAASETVDVQITSYGDETYAAGFFMDNYNATATASATALTPEPATLLLLSVGAGTAMLRRRRR
jgi:opacity protein-like surface antigen